MPISLNQKPEHGFDQPLGLLSDCHRRVEKFLGVLARVSSERRGQELAGQHREAMEAALRYFKNAAPWHTQDEEASLFPRMRRLDDPRVREAFARLDALEADHRHAEPMHAEVDRLGRRWLAGPLENAEADRLDALVTELRATYQRHIRVEDEVIFPLAGRALSDHALKAVGREMAERRGIDPGLPPRRCKHAGTGRSPAAEL